MTHDSVDSADKVCVDGPETSVGCSLEDVSITTLLEDSKYNLHKLPTVPCLGHIDTKVAGSSSDLNCSDLDTI